MAKQAKVEIEGKEFILQHPGARAATQMRDRCKNKNGHLHEENFYSELMKHVIVQPKVDWDYFDQEGNEESFEPLMQEAVKFVLHDKSFRGSNLQAESGGK